MRTKRAPNTCVVWQPSCERCRVCRTFSPTPPKGPARPLQNSEASFLHTHASKAPNPGHHMTTTPFSQMTRTQTPPKYQNTTHTSGCRSKTKSKAMVAGMCQDCHSWLIPFVPYFCLSCRSISPLAVDRLDSTDFGDSTRSRWETVWKSRR